MNEVLRQEKKYAINLADGVVLGERLGAVMHADAHNGAQGYTIRSLYFDDCFNTAMSDKIDGVQHRDKYRIRIYNRTKSTA